MAAMVEPEQGTNYSPLERTTSGWELPVPATCAGLRADQALARMLPDYSRSRLQDWMRRGRVTRNGTALAPRDKVWNGERLHVDAEPDPKALATLPEAIPLEIAYEDGAILVVNKPAGLVVHPGSGNPRGTLQNALLAHAPETAWVARCGIVHRLDKDTSGLLVVAKTIPAQVSLVRQLQDRTMKREYLAVVHGEVPFDAAVDAPIGRHPAHRTRMAVVSTGRVARTHYRVVERIHGFTLLRIALDTGRTHQIRVHMHSVGFPLVGDPVYRRAGLPDCPAVARRFHRQALHAETLGLFHPETGEPMQWTAPLPADMVALISDLRMHSLPRRDAL